MGCSKFILFVLNFLVFLAGVIVVGLASVVINRTNTFTDLLQDGILTIPVIILIIALIVTLIGFFGCFGALRENRCMLNTYAAIVLILFIAQLTLGVLVFIYQDQAKTTTKLTMSGFFEKYDEGDETLKRSIDSMQSDLECCGVSSYEDWFTILSGNDVTIGCCRRDTDIDQCYQNVKDDQESIYTIGCYDALEGLVKNVSLWLGVFAIILAVIQLLCILLACGLSKTAARRGEYA